MKVLIYLLLIVLSNVLLYSCGTKNEYDSFFVQAEEKLKSNPDSALEMLNRMKMAMEKAPKKYQMKYIICLADAQNKLYKKILPARQIEKVISYYKHTNNPFQEARSNYLLGCFYRDKGESPLALDCYRRAIVLCDTADERYYGLLNRIYAQMADVFYQQFLPNDMIWAEKNSCKYALLDNDIYSCATSLNRMSLAFDMLNKTDSSISVTIKSMQLYDKIGQHKHAGEASGILVSQYLKKRNYKLVKFYMDKYERQSGLFDEFGNIEKGREIYYFDKGQYFCDLNKYDSADYCFRRTLSNKDDENCQEAGNYGLYLLYKKLENVDSVAKYADLAYQVSDKRMLTYSTHEIQNMQQLYNYTRNQEMAKLEREKAERLKQWIAIIIMCVVVIGISVFYSYKRVKQRRKLERREFQQHVGELVAAKEKQKMILANQIMRIKEDNERHIAELNTQLSAFQEKKHISDNQLKIDLLQASEICSNFHKVGKGLEHLIPEDWNVLEQKLFEELPDFKCKLLGVKAGMQSEDYHLCLLTRLHFAPYEICNILGLKSSTVTMKRKRLMNIVFGCNGKARDFDRKLQELY